MTGKKNIKYRYIREGRAPFACIAMLRLKEANRILYAISACSRQDRFTKDAARSLARSRLLIGDGRYIEHAPSLKTSHEFTLVVLRDIIMRYDANPIGNHVSRRLARAVVAELARYFPTEG